MDTNQTYQAINPNTFDALLKDYPEIVTEKLAELDEQRYDIIPGSLKELTASKHLTKSQVATLVDWKLSHGKFRPTLKALVQKNSESTVEEVTKDAFAAFTATKGPNRVRQAVNALTKLQGIGPATASLLLSVYDPDHVPFFSDELFRWCSLDDGRGEGWDREIKYNIKEYLELVEKVEEFKRRFSDRFERDVSAVEMEKVAYVLGKRAAGVEHKAGRAKRKAETAVDEGNDRVADETVGEVKKVRAKKTLEKNAGVVKKASSVTTETTAAASRPKRARK